MRIKFIRNTGVAGTQYPEGMVCELNDKDARFLISTQRAIEAPEEEKKRGRPKKTADNE
jgi:hypothetical protein